MRPLVTSGIDMRAFAWPLLPLERKLAWDRDAARLRVAQALGAVQAAQRQLHALEALRAGQDGLPSARAGAFDPGAHLHMLRYLGSLQAKLLLAARQLQLREQALVAARAACGDCERSLESVATVRVSAMGEHVRAALLRQERVADAAWLLRDQAVRATMEVDQ